LVFLAKSVAIELLWHGMKNNYKFNILSFIIPVILNVQTVWFGFTDFDDNRMIKENSAFLSDFGNIINAFQTDAFITGTSQFYRPVQIVSYMIDILVAGGVHAWMFHLSNILLYGLMSCLLFGFLKLFFTSPYFTLLVTLLFASHPLFVPIVSWIPARGDLLLSVFALISFITLHKYIRSNQPLYLVIHVMSFIFALFAKETAAVLPAVFLSYYLIKTSRRFSDRKGILILVLYLITGFIWVWLRSMAIGDFYSNEHTNDIIGLTPLFQNLRIIPESIFKFIFPLNPGPIPAFSSLAIQVGLVLMIGLVIVLVLSKSISPEIRIISLMWFFILMIPPLLFKHVLIDYLDHRFFLPMIGLLPVLSIFQRFITRTAFLRIGQVFATILLVLFAVLTIHRSSFYSDPVKFYTSAIKYNPASSIAHNNLGAIHHSRGNYNKAISEYSLAIKIKSDYLNAINNRANAYLSAGFYLDAINDYNLVIDMDPMDAFSYNNRGVAFIRISKVSDACRDFDSAMRLGSQSALNNRKRFCK
jgi:protein O-mannosyl-transferase